MPYTQNGPDSHESGGEGIFLIDYTADRTYKTFREAKKAHLASYDAAIWSLKQARKQAAAMKLSDVIDAR